MKLQNVALIIYLVLRAFYYELTSYTSLNFLKSFHTFVAVEFQRHTQQEHTYTKFTSSNAPRNLIKFNNSLSSFFANYKLIIICIRLCTKSLTLYVIYCK